MLHQETYMTQRTFNEINACSADEQCEEDMEAEPMPKSKRGRKRQSDEAGLSEGERIRKEKNRKAAQKCREKKEKEARDLKNRNEELEAENKKLSDDKKKLEDRAREFHRIIGDHMAKGCKLPADVQELYNEDAKIISSHTCNDEVFRAVGIIERDHTPPHTPEDFSHENMSSNVHYRANNSQGFTGASPTALFSGTPLFDSEMARRSGSSSRSSSSSPAPTNSRVNQDLSLTRQNNFPLLFFKHSQLSIPTRQGETSLHGDRNQSVHHSRQILPTVVAELNDEESDSTTEYTSQSFSLLDQESKPMEADMPSNWPLENVAKQASSESHSAVNEEHSQNLPSLGFSCVSDYSYTKDLQQLESVQEIIEYTNDGSAKQSQKMHSDKKKSSVPSSDQSVGSEKKNPSGPSTHHDSQPIIDINVGAQALLDMATEMTDSLKQQIQTNYKNSQSSKPGAMLTTGENQRNGFAHQGADQAQGNNFKPDLSQQQQVYLLKQDQWTANVQNSFEAPKEEQCLGNQSVFIQDVYGQTQIIIKPVLVSEGNCGPQSQQSAQLQETSQPVQCQEPHQIQRQFSGQNLPLRLQSSRVCQEEEMQQSYPTTKDSQDMLPQVRQQSYATTKDSQDILSQVRQQSYATTKDSQDILSPVRQQQTNLGPPASKFGQSHLFNISSPITSAQAAGYTTPNPGLHSRSGLQPSSVVFTCSSSSHDSTASRLPPQQAPVSKPHQSNEVFKDVQIRYGYTQLASSSAAAQEHSLSSESLAGVLENIDYGANVEDLPSLNFLELQSDSNLFEKKPSRLAS